MKANGPLLGKESQPLLWQCLKSLPGSMEHTTKAAEGSYNRQSQQTSAIRRPTAPLFSFLESVVKYWQTGHCETRRANHCCRSVSNHYHAPSNTPQSQQKAATTANHNKHQPYLGQLPPFFHSWRVLSNTGKWAIVRQGEPTIVVAMSQDIARVHGTHHQGSTRPLQPPIKTNISHT